VPGDSSGQGPGDGAASAEGPAPGSAADIDADRGPTSGEVATLDAGSRDERPLIERDLTDGDLIDGEPIDGDLLTLEDSLSEADLHDGDPLEDRSSPLVDGDLLELDRAPGTTAADTSTEGDGAAGAPAPRRTILGIRTPRFDLRARYDPSRIETHYIPLGILAVIVFWWVRIFIPLTVNQHRYYYTSDFDLGIFDQASWLLAHGRGFITVRGLEFLGHHLNFGLLLFAPAYWLGAGPEFLNVMAVLAIAASVIPITAICRHYRPAQSWMGLAFSFGFLFAAVPQWIIAESFHPEVMAIPFMFAALWAAIERRWRLYIVFLILVVIWKEDLSFFLIMLGLGVAWKRDRRIGLITSAVGIAYFVLATKFILPHFAGGDAFYSGFLGDLGNTPSDLIANAVLRPTKFTDKYNANNGTGYFLGLQQPWLYTSLLSPSALLIGFPSYFINIFSSEGYTQDLHRHYVTIPFVASAYAAIRGTASRSTKAIRASLAVGIVLMAVWTRQSGTGPWTNTYAGGLWALQPSTHTRVFDEAVAMVPSDASVAASYMIVPHLTRRPEIYTFPNPWITENWAISDNDPRSPDRVDWLVIDEGSSSGDKRVGALVESLRSGPCWETKLDKDKVLVLHRTQSGPQCSVSIMKPS
jgi:uncharacterized membrane protein